MPPGPIISRFQGCQNTCSRAIAVVLLALMSSLTAHGTEVPESAAKADEAALHQLLADYWDERLSLEPALALAQGDLRFETEFDDSLEDSWRERMLSMLEHYQRALERFRNATLSPEDQTSVRLLDYHLDRDKRFYGSRLFEVARMLPINQFDGLHTAFAMDAAGSGNYPFNTVADYDHALVRADHFARWADSAIVRLREGVDHGVVLPRLVVERLLPQLDTVLNRAPTDTEFWRPVDHLPNGMAASDKERLRLAYQRKIAEVMQPSYQRLRDYLAREYLPHARLTSGLGEMNEGAALYRYDVRFHTTTDLNPKQIHAIGRREVANILLELDRLRQQVKFHGSWRAFLDSVRSDPQQHFANPDDVIPAYEAARQRIVGHLPDLFTVMPKARYEIRALPESARASSGNGNYVAAAADGSRPGILWMNIYAPGVLDRFNVMTISLHEGLPGHHFQTSISQEHTELPAFRRFDDTTAYVEGWGLYAESLGRETALFDDPWQYFGHLQYALLRANRLVIDTGIHALGWDIPRSVRWMMTHSSMNKAQATAEVERYVALPGQALAYKIGEMKIRELRERAAQQLGAQFDLRLFHDQILAGGGMPLAVLDIQIDHWIASQRPSPPIASPPIQPFGSP